MKSNIIGKDAHLVLRALSEPTRLELLARIGHGSICACNLPELVGKSQPATSQHLKVLLGAGLVSMRRKGTKRLYSATEKGKRALEDISGW